MAINVADFWPILTRGQARRFHYESIDNSQEPFTSVFWFNPAENSMVLVDYDKGNQWRDTWFYRHSPTDGISEWKDQSPQKGLLAKIFGVVNNIAYTRPIMWGHIQEIGSYAISFPAMDPFKSWPPQWQSGKQVVVFEELLPSFTTVHGDTYETVLLYSYLQQWGSTVAGARYWAAKGIGPIAVEFFGVPPNEITWLGVDHGKINFIRTARYDAHVSGSWT